MKRLKVRRMTDFSPEEISAMAVKAEHVRPSHRGLARIDVRTMVALPELGLVGDILDGAAILAQNDDALRAGIRSVLEAHGLTVSEDSRRRAKPVDFIVGRIGIVARLGEDRFAAYQVAGEYAALPHVIGLVFVSPFSFPDSGATLVATPVRFVQVGKSETVSCLSEAAPEEARRRSGRATAERMLKRAAASRLVPEVVEVDNPYWSRAHEDDPTNPRTVKAVRNANESPIVMLETRGAITPSQAAAGLKFRRLYERAMAGTPSPSDIKERVDGGGRPDALSDDRMQAGRALMTAAEALGQGGYWLVRAVCGDGHSIREIAKRVRIRRPAAVSALRWALDELAEAWKLASEGAAAESRKSAA